MKGDEANFPIDVDSPLIKFLQSAILWSIKILALLMALVILWSVVDVLLLMFIKAQAPYQLITNIDEVLSLFGAFLIVLIAIEIFLNIILYLKKDMGHIKLVIATALMAISRKVIILDYNEVAHWHMFGIGAIILSLGLAYWLISHSNQRNPQLQLEKITPINNNENN